MVTDQDIHRMLQEHEPFRDAVEAIASSLGRAMADPLTDEERQAVVWVLDQALDDYARMSTLPSHAALPGAPPLVEIAAAREKLCP